MPKLITETAQMKCDKGSAPSQLKVTSQHFDMIDGKLQATEKDIQPNQNIPPFGACTMTRKSCNPSLQQWQQTSVFTIDELKELTNKSFCMCSQGGKITFTNCGQSGFVINDEN